MVELKAQSPCAGRAARHGDARLREVGITQITSVAPFRGKTERVSTELKAAIGVGLPQTGRLLASAEGQVLWSGQDQYFVTGVSVPALDAAVTDQSDAWVCLALEGEGAVDVLARLCPLDLARTDEGDVARSLVGHMSCILVRRSDGFEIMAFRSMASTLWHELEDAMQSVAARGKIN